MESIIKTFLGSVVRTFKETAVDFNLPAGRYVEMKILIDDGFIVDLKYWGLKEILSNFKKLNLNLSANHYEPTHGLKGITKF